VCLEGSRAIYSLLVRVFSSPHFFFTARSPLIICATDPKERIATAPPSSPIQNSVEARNMFFDLERTPRYLGRTIQRLVERGPHKRPLYHAALPDVRAAYRGPPSLASWVFRMPVMVPLFLRFSGYDLSRRFTRPNPPPFDRARFATDLTLSLRLLLELHISL